jgi:hypothetical protein
LNAGATRFATRYPQVWHVIEADGAGAWLNQTGLLPAAELVRLANLTGNGANRDTFQSIDLGCGRIAVLRLQQMPDQRLLLVLAGAFAERPDLWRRHVDRHVFFWAEQRRRDAFIRACIRLRPGARPPVTLTFDTALLLERHGPIAFFATINSGSTVRGGARAQRDEKTLRPAANYHSGPVAELAIRGPVDISGIAACDT